MGPPAAHTTPIPLLDKTPWDSMEVVLEADMGRGVPLPAGPLEKSLDFLKLT